MIELKEMTLATFLYKAIEIAKEKGTEQLVSWTIEIEPLDVLSAFASAKQLNKNRIFWTNSTNDFTLFGLGTIHRLTAEDNRFERLDEAWKAIERNALIHEATGEAGTGLVAVGGMSFDPRREKSKLWSNYPTSQMTIPEYTIVQNKDAFFFTANLYVDENSLEKKLANDIEHMMEFLMSHVPQQKNAYQKIISKREIEPEKWKRSVEAAVEEIQKDRAKKIVLAREMRIKLDREANIAGMLKRLKETQPNSYIFAFEHGPDCFLGATPERLVRVNGKKLLSTCLAGTAPRGKTAEEDSRIAENLLNDQKNRKEHDYVVQMIRQGIEKYCDNIDMPKEPVIFPLKNLQHLYTPVTATLKKECTVFDIVRELHPTPALGGVPREKALSFIREQELLDRGWYGAPIGWLDSRANSEFAVALRSGLAQGDEVSLFAGCGVMGDSDPEKEYDETNVKFLPMLTILEDTDESY